MASSVSSEQSFSAAGITISKRCNQLKRDIVEALQCLKCLYHKNIIFCEVLTSTEVEADMDLTEMILDNSYENKADLDILDKDNDLFLWNQLIPDDDD
jgi:hAT family C-terminal dimerisation region